MVFWKATFHGLKKKNDDDNENNNTVKAFFFKHMTACIFAI